jgi:hypothetical protein
MTISRLVFWSAPPKINGGSRRGIAAFALNDASTTANGTKNARALGTRVMMGHPPEI